MTDKQRQSLLQACAFAKVFQQVADLELRGEPSNPRREAAKKLIAALKVLDDDQQAFCADPGCNHELFWHTGMTGGMCLKATCKCLKRSWRGYEAYR